jgi:hypothetical protein
LTFIGQGVSNKVLEYDGTGEIDLVCVTCEKATMDLNFLFLVFVAMPFLLINITAYRKQRKKTDEELQALLPENHTLLQELLAKEIHPDASGSG